MTRYEYAVQIKTPEDGRGEHSEEVHVTIPRRSTAAALRAAQRILDDEYDPGCQAVRATLLLVRSGR